MLPLIAVAMLIASCGTASTSAAGKKSIVVTYSVLGSIVKDLVGDKAVVTVLIPNGADPHEWEPSARDIELINKADLVVENGLGLEASVQKSLERARSAGVTFFTASDHITIRHVGQGEGVPTGDSDQVAGAPDPHLWLDPAAMKSLVGALSIELAKDFSTDVSVQAAVLENRLDALDREIAGMVAAIPQENRKLVTGHESMGYYAERYGFKLVGVIIPGVSSQAEVSAANLATLKQTIEENHVKAIFTELGTSPSVAKAIGEDTGVEVVELATHVLPDDGSYFSFLRNLTAVITAALK